MASDGDLGDLLAKALPTGVELTVRHVSSTPAPSTALFAAAPGREPEATFCENHFLTVSIDSPKVNGGEIIVFGMEVLVYNTAHLTTIFVSKADSTGFLHLLKVGQKVSVLRLISNTFLSFLVQTHQRPGVRLVVSLFARAQNQYLFPGSIDNAEKHVLDDRGLIKWWCRAVDPILRDHEPESVSKDSKLMHQGAESAKASATAYLIVPGCDRFETRNFFPLTAKSDGQDRPRWLSSYPVNQMCHDPSAPPRCLIPRLPDDPKTRFLIDLDDELPESAEGQDAPPSTGLWRSVRSLDQFWEMMSFRQECSAGRLVGFLWLVVNPPGLMNSTTMASRIMSAVPSDKIDNGVHVFTSTDSGDKLPTDAPKLSGEHSAEIPEPQAVTPPHFDHPPVASSTELQSNEIIPFYWPEAGRGNVVFNEAEYKKMMDCVLDHFYDESEIVASTKDYIDQVASLADQLTWGKRVVGTRKLENTTTYSAETNTLDIGLVRKRKKSASGGETKGSNEAIIAQPRGADEIQSTPSQPVAVNVLSAGLVRKKKKI
ncbi:hypothetical protein N7462_003310 [Penicillium macrosclerotiorum]|uniref:uncharacterized protein n=1 Tax=Penicillium macrosclerotiorum TaxID=303699 RepID=UPI0025468AB6|nr:uncharacterized protein N7462_003310 [Penicillium macrosclerotiorum]KAJ5688918.1 hypothetical protein N7462_003310 [Penicillium macrosclerotiorum]